MASISTSSSSTPLLQTLPAEFLDKIFQLMFESWHATIGILDRSDDNWGSSKHAPLGAVHNQDCTGFMVASKQCRDFVTNWRDSTLGA